VDSRSVPQQRQGERTPRLRSAPRDSSAHPRVRLHRLHFADVDETQSVSFAHQKSPISGDDGDTANRCSSQRCNSKSVEVCRTPRNKSNSGSPNTIGDRSTGGVALPAVPPVTVREPHTGSHRVGGRWNCKPEISDAEQTGGLRRTRVFDSLDSGFLRVYAEEDVNTGLSGPIGIPLLEEAL